MNEPLLHPLTQRTLDHFVAQPSHSAALIGAKGIGKSFIANYLEQQILTDDTYFITIEPDKDSIGIDDIRSLEHQLRLKVPNKSHPNRLVWIADAELMTHEAQNALLKTLEEPPEGTILLLGIADKQRVLPTILSRVIELSIRQPDRAAVEQYFTTQGFNASDITKAMLASGGLPGLMHALLTESEHPLVAATSDARELLTLSRYERLLKVDELSKDKTRTLNMLYILGQMAHIRLATADNQDTSQWGSILEHSYEANEAIIQNGNVKLAWDKLLLSL